jgi:formylglycine-generating enzyme
MRFRAASRRSQARFHPRILPGCLPLKPFSVSLAVLACLLAAPAGAAPISYLEVTVGNAGNVNDAGGGLIGAVAYDYQIGKYDVTIGQYTAFLNAVAATDTYSLYNPSMGNTGYIAGISQANSSGNYSYSVIGSADRPITYVSWWDSARFSNWMANGQPTGAQSSTTTENGAYNINGAISGDAVAKNAINPNTSAVPTFFIPTENEWYKAAYYSPDLTGGYYAYATQSDTAPGNVVGSAANQANWFTGLGYSVTQLAFIEDTNYLTAVGTFSGSESFYGTFDQSGNVFQWNDLDGTAGSSRGLRGGSWGNGDPGGLSSSNTLSFPTSYEGGLLGFRLASPVSGSSVPEIDPATGGSALSLVAGVLAMIEQRRRRATHVA